MAKATKVTLVDTADYLVNNKEAVGDLPKGTLNNSRTAPIRRGINYNNTENTAFGARKMMPKKRNSIEVSGANVGAKGK